MFCRVIQTMFPGPYRFDACSSTPSSSRPTNRRTSPTGARGRSRPGSAKGYSTSLPGSWGSAAPRSGCATSSVPTCSRRRWSPDRPSTCACRPRPPWRGLSRSPTSNTGRSTRRRLGNRVGVSASGSRPTSKRLLGRPGSSTSSCPASPRCWAPSRPGSPRRRWQRHDPHPAGAPWPGPRDDARAGGRRRARRPVEAVRVQYGDTNVAPFGMAGTGGSRSAAMAGGAVGVAAAHAARAHRRHRRGPAGGVAGRHRHRGR